MSDEWEVIPAASVPSERWRLLVNGTDVTYFRSAIFGKAVSDERLYGLLGNPFGDDG